MLVDTFLAKFAFDGKDAAHDAETLEDKFDSMRHTIERIGHIEAFKFVAEGISSIVEKVAGVGEMAEHIQNMAFAAGIGAEQLQKLQYSAQQSGLGADDVNMAMSRLSRGLNEARTGSKQAIGMFAELGIPQGQLASLKDGGQALMAVADRIRSIQDPAKRTALAQQLLGRNAAGAVRWLSKGAAGINAMGEEGQKLGAVLETDTLKSLEETADAISSVWMVVKSFTATLLNAFAPSIRYVVDALKGWWSANRRLIGDRLIEWINELLFGIGFVIGAVHGVIRFIHAWADAHKELIETIETLVVKFKDDLVEAVSASAKAVIDWVKEHKEGLEIAGRWLGLITALGLAYKVITDIGPGASAGIRLIGKAISSYETVALTFMYTMDNIAAAFAAIDLEVAALIALLAGLVLIGQAAWQVMHGKKMEDTWLGALMTKGAAEKFGGIFDLAKAFGATDDSQNQFEVGNNGMIQPKTSSGGAPAQPAIPAWNSKSMTKGAANLQSLWDMTAASSTPAGQAAAANASMPTMAPVTNNISLPVTINNVPSGLPADQVMARIDKTVRDALDQTALRAASSVDTAIVH